MWYLYGYLGIGAQTMRLLYASKQSTLKVL